MNWELAIGGVYLAESRDPRLPWSVRFLGDVLNGIPSIVIGIFAYTVIVLPMRRFSALAGGFEIVLSCDLVVAAVMRPAAAAFATTTAAGRAAIWPV